jgi:hypothetical protein
MPKVTFVKKARKDVPNSDIKAGESYYWWAFMQGGRGGPKIVSRTKPKQSQLTQSEFWSAVFGVREDNDGRTPDFEDLEPNIENITNELENIKDETQGKYDNLPDGLRDGSSGELLQGRIDALESAISDLESIDLSWDEPEKADDETDEQFEERKETEKDERAEEIWSDALSALDGISCD